MTIGEWLAQASEKLEALAIESARLEAQLLLSHALNLDRAQIIANPNRYFDPENANEFLKRRLNREPLAYILGSVEFYGRRFSVRPGVLIPRQDTEILVEAALQLPEHPLQILDLCTGSGCIATTLALERPNWKVTGSDISPGAIQIAYENSAQLGARVAWMLSDLLTTFANQSFDAIVCNPPYIGESEPIMHEVRDCEPKIALFAEENGLAVYRRIAAKAKQALKPKGWIALEVGHEQSHAVKQIFQNKNWTWKQTLNDLAGHERVVVFEP